MFWVFRMSVSTCWTWAIVVSSTQRGWRWYPASGKVAVLTIIVRIVAAIDQIARKLIWRIHSTAVNIAQPQNQIAIRISVRLVDLYSLIRATPLTGTGDGK